MRTRPPARLLCPLLAGLVLLTAAPASAQVGIQIVGGTTAEPGEYPWQVAVYTRTGGPNSFSFICGGTLISEFQVLTAAHCTTGNAHDEYRVLVGTQFRNSGGTVISVSSNAEHPQFDSGTLENDAAVLQLAASGVDAGGQPLQLIGQEGSADDTIWSSGKMLAISGWGSTCFNTCSSVNQLREARVPRVADTTCDDPDWYGSEFIAATMVCAGFEAGGVDTCQGDSGGPLAASTQNPLPSSENNPSQWRLVGITSWGFGCANPNQPGVYTRVAAPAIRNWILGQITEQFELSVTKSGAGSGAVTSSPAGINCGSTCLKSFNEGQVVTLTASPASNSTFAGWSGEGCSGTGTCVVTMDQARDVTATFNLKPLFQLSVTKDGTGSGTVTSSPAGINCGSTCSASFIDGQVVTLTAVAGAGSEFGGWSGEGCNGTGTCQVTMSQARDVTATFNPVPQFDLSVTKGGSGSGTVTSSPAGINCGSTCSALFNEDTVVTLSASAGSNSAFAGWSGDCSGTGVCQVTMSQARDVTATFNQVPQFQLSVMKGGSGSGTVTSSPGGINCGSTCSANYNSGTSVVLSASPAAGSTFAGWSGACSGSGSCTVSMTQARAVTATFNLVPKFALSVTKGGAGSGTVTSSPGGISCGSDCSQSYNVGTDVVLTASPASGSTFGEWSGACSGTGTCAVSMDGARSVTATFTAQASTRPPSENEPPPPDVEPSPTPPDETPPVADISSNRLVMSKRGFVRVGVDCSDSPEDCLTDIRLRMRFPEEASVALVRTVAHGAFDISAGDTKRVKMRLKRRARRRVRQEGHVRVRVIMVVEDAAGNARTLREKLTLRAAE